MQVKIAAVQYVLISKWPCHGRFLVLPMECTVVQARHEKRNTLRACCPNNFRCHHESSRTVKPFSGLKVEAVRSFDTLVPTYKPRRPTWTNPCSQEPTAGPYLSQMNLVCSPTLYFFKIHFNNFFPSTPRSSTWYLPY